MEGCLHVSVAYAESVCFPPLSEREQQWRGRPGNGCFLRGLCSEVSGNALRGPLEAAESLVGAAAAQGVAGTRRRVHPS